MMVGMVVRDAVLLCGLQKVKGERSGRTSHLLMMVKLLPPLQLLALSTRTTAFKKDYDIQTKSVVVTTNDAPQVVQPLADDGDALVDIAAFCPITILNRKKESASQQLSKPNAPRLSSHFLTKVKLLPPLLLLALSTHLIVSTSDI
jgi:hypothetical protein